MPALSLDLMPRHDGEVEEKPDAEEDTEQVGSLEYARSRDFGLSMLCSFGKEINPPGRVAGHGPETGLLRRPNSLRGRGEASPASVISSFTDGKRCMVVRRWVQPD